MFFNQAIEKLGHMPNNLIEPILAQGNSFNIEVDIRKYFGVNSTGSTFANMTPRLQSTVRAAEAYVSEQKFPILQGRYAVESGLCNMFPTWPGFIRFPTRLIYRLSEQIVIPILGEATVNSTEFKQTVIMETGSIYRLNNRTESEIVAQDNFLALVFIYLDGKNIKERSREELGEMCARQRDEYLIKP
jgi:hypothetical protein